jgi:hypothetical protein
MVAVYNEVIAVNRSCEYESKYPPFCRVSEPQLLAVDECHISP